MALKIALIGRPNVGKSTLFNRLVRRKLALVDDRPGVTRDLREGAGRLGSLRFDVIDTAGIEDAATETLQARMTELSEKAISSADICLFLYDARTGVTSADEILAQILRKNAQNIVLVANKAEGRAADTGVTEGFSLGLGEPVALSAEHGIGLDELTHQLSPFFTQESQLENEGLDSESIEGKDGPLQIAVLGRPNAGKSTLVNQISGQDRLLTGPEAGITRDAIAISTEWQGLPVRIFDTAGIRKRAKVQDKLEKLSVADGLRAVRFAEVVILMLDAAIPFEQQDLRLADLAAEEGRALVVAVNKWDEERDKKAKHAALAEAFTRLLPQLRGAPLIPVSAKTGSGLKALFAGVEKAYEIWNKRISTAKLNIWLEHMIAAHPPPAPSGRRINIKFITQAKTRPPTFIVKTSQPDKINDSYCRYLIAGLRRDFDLPGTPIRLFIKGQSAENPFQGRKAPAPSKLRKHKNKTKSRPER